MMKLYLDQIGEDIFCYMSRPHRCLNIRDSLYNLSHKKPGRKKDEGVLKCSLFILDDDSNVIVPHKGHDESPSFGAEHEVQDLYRVQL